MNIDTPDFCASRVLLIFTMIINLVKNYRLQPQSARITVNSVAIFQSESSNHLVKRYEGYASPLAHIVVYLSDLFTEYRGDMGLCSTSIMTTCLEVGDLSLFIQ